MKLATIMTAQTNNTTIYFLGNIMYINVTNLCTNKCVFCIRSVSDTVAGSNLWLSDQNACAQEIIEDLKTKLPEIRDEIVFCGYGEPLIQLDTVKEVAKFIKQNYPNVPTRLNTNGHGNLIHKKDIVPVLKGLIDKVSVSLNSDNAQQYKELTNCSYDADIAFEAVKEFIKKCADAGMETTATVVSGYKDHVINLKNCEALALSLGANFKVREWLEEGYN
jgi:TatD family-associated radical SAM protein